MPYKWVNNVSQLLAIVLALTMAACSDRRVDPLEVRYSLYASIRDSIQGRIAVIDCDSDSIRQMLTSDGFASPLLVDASPGGKYISITPARQVPFVWDIASQTLVAHLTAPGERLVYLPDKGKALSWDLNVTRFYSMPDFELDTTWLVNLYLPKRIPHSSLVMAIDKRGPSSAPQDHSLVTFLDLETETFVDPLVIDSAENGVGFQIYEYDLSPDGRRFYALGAMRGGGASLLCYDLHTRTIVFRKSVLIPNGHCRVTLDGKEIWYSDPGTIHPAYEQGPGVIVILDALSGTTLDTIPTQGFDPDDSSRPLFVQEICFVPEADKAYVKCGTFLRGAEPILIISPSSRTIIGVLFPGFDVFADNIDLGPSP